MWDEAPHIGLTEETKEDVSEFRLKPEKLVRVYTATCPCSCLVKLWPISFSTRFFSR